MSTACKYQLFAVAASFLAKILSQTRCACETQVLPEWPFFMKNVTYIIYP